MVNYSETKTRSLTKTIVWRVIAMLITWVVLWYFTGEIVDSLNITIVITVLAMITYYVHERVWAGIQWGKTLDEE